MDYVSDTILDRTRAAAAPPKLVVLDLSATPYVDMQSASALASLAGELKSLNIHLQVVEAHSSVRERLRGEGLDARLGGIDRFTSVADAVDAFQKQI
jgi:MFS superfamily sulfate permease-like transporter